MASASTTRWVSTAPYVTLSAFIENETDTEANIRWELTYTSDSPADTSVNKAYVIEVNNSTEKSGTYDIDGKTGTKTIASGDYTVTKTHSKQSYSFRVEFAFNMKWSGVSANTLTASLTLTVPAKTSYTIKYNANDGSGAPASQTKWHGETLTLWSTKPTRSGYTFKGWSKSASGSVKYSPGGSFDENASLTLYAVWAAVTYMVTYNANGGSGAPASQPKTYGVTLTLSSTKPTRSNYKFRGWGTSASATAVAYNPGGSYTANKSATLYAIWDLAYVKPRITNVSVYRCNNDADKTPNDRAENAYVSFAWACDQPNPTITVELFDSSGLVRSTSSNRTGSSGTFSTVLLGNISPEKTYTARITVTDTLGSDSVSRTLSGTKYAIDLLAGAKGVSFGKPAEHDGYADFGYKFHIDNNLAMFGTNREGKFIEAFNLSNQNGNTVLGWGNYATFAFKKRYDAIKAENPTMTEADIIAELAGSDEFNTSTETVIHHLDVWAAINAVLEGNPNAETSTGYTNIYGNDIHFGVANIPNPGTYRPYCRRGDALTFTLRTAGYVTNAGKDVTFIVPFAVPILGGATATATSVNGFVLRQNEAYTHGSASDTYIHPDSYSASVSMFCGVYVTAHFSTTAAAINVVNNAPIGIYWNGTITLS